MIPTSELITEARNKAMGMEFSLRWIVLEMAKRLEVATSVDAVPVVRCRNCVCSFMANGTVEFNGAYLCSHPKGLSGKLDLDTDYCCHGIRSHHDSLCDQTEEVNHE